MRGRRYRIRLDLDVAGDEISGSAAASGAPPRDFTGWLGLIASIDALTTAEGAAGAPATDVPPAETDGTGGGRGGR